MTPNLPAQSDQIARPPAPQDDDRFALESFNAGVLPLAASFDPTTASGRIQALKMLGAPAGDLRKIRDVAVTVAAVAIFRQDGVNSSDGELLEKTKVSWLLDDGRVIKFASASAIDTFRRIIVSLGGLPRVKFPMRLIAREVPHDPYPYFVVEELPEGGE